MFQNAAIPPNYPPQNYAMYPNCFDQLTTHGIIADDLVGYVTGTPSPYLQNYVAQRGWPPTMPGRIMPDPLPTMPPMQYPSQADSYQPQQAPSPQANPQPYPQKPQNTTVKKDKLNTFNKIALGGLLVGLGVLGFFKGKQAFNWISSLIPTAPTSAPVTGNWFQRTWARIKNYFI